MRGSRNDAALALTLAVGALFAIAGGEAQAQTSAPLRLTPDPPSAAAPALNAPMAPLPGAPARAPIQLTPLAPPDDAAPDQPLPEPAERGQSPDAAIKVRSLDAPDPDAAGILRPEAGAFGEDLWSGSARREVATFLEALPAPMISPVQRTLALRLLLSAGDFPAAGVGDPAGRRYGAIRVEKVAALGDAKDARALADKLPGVLADEPAARALIRAELANGSLDCAKAVDTIRAFDTDFWRRLDVFCRAQRGERDSAQVGLDMLREKGDIDPAYEAAVEKMAGEPATAPAKAGEPDIVTLAALRAAGFAPPPDALSKTGPFEAALIARNPATDPATRVTAAEKAAAVVLMDARELQATYAAVPNTGEDLSRLASAEPTAVTRALVSSAMNGAIDGKRRADIAGLGARLVPPAWRAGPVGIAATALFDSIGATAANGTVAPLAFKLFAAQGQKAKAQRWYLPLAANDRLRRDAVKLWPLALLADATPEGGLDLDIDVWVDTEGRANPLPKTLNLLPALQALGVAVPAEAVDRLGATASLVSSPDVVNRLSRASGEGRLGETVLIAIDLLGDGGPAQAQPGVLARVVDALVANGLENDARALAREAAAAWTD